MSFNASAFNSVYTVFCWMMVNGIGLVLITKNKCLLCVVSINILAHLILCVNELLHRLPTKKGIIFCNNVFLGSIGTAEPSLVKLTHHRRHRSIPREVTPS